MQTQQQIEGLTDGVVIPDEAVQASNEKKKKASRTLSQLPVYRDVCSLKESVVLIMTAKNAPNKMRGFYDTMIESLADAQRSIGLASEKRNYPELRCDYIDMALASVYVVGSDLSLLKKHNLGVSSDLYNKLKSVVKRIVAQLKAWRDYTNSEGTGIQNRKDDEK